MTTLLQRHFFSKATYTLPTRILSALQGALAIRNSGQPANPPLAGKQVIGLCGQGGRHAYFRVPVAALEDAVQEILGLRTFGDVRSASDMLAAVCAKLRRQTTFDSATSCVNDQVPSLVPLFPPEEVWCNGSELPLDVWRLINFDIDLVSSAISSDAPIDDIAFGSFTQAGLAFRSIMNRIENFGISFSVAGVNLSALFPTSLSGTPLQVAVPLARVFFEAGCLLHRYASQIRHRGTQLYQIYQLDSQDNIGAHGSR